MYRLDRFRSFDGYELPERALWREIEAVGTGRVSGRREVWRGARGVDLAVVEQA